MFLSVGVGFPVCVSVFRCRCGFSSVCLGFRVKVWVFQCMFGFSTLVICIFFARSRMDPDLQHFNLN